MKRFRSSPCKQRRGWSRDAAPDSARLLPLLQHRAPPSTRASQTLPQQPAALSLPSSHTLKSLRPETCWGSRAAHCAPTAPPARPSLPRGTRSPGYETRLWSSRRGRGPGAGGTWTPGWRPLTLFIKQTPPTARKEAGQAGKLAVRYRSCHRRMTASSTSDPHQVTRSPLPGWQPKCGGAGTPLRQHQEGSVPPLTPSPSKRRAGAELPE